MSHRSSARTANALIGSPLERIEDLRFLRGRGEYVDDVTRPGLLHAVILRSSVAHGRIVAIDAAAARARAGVHAVITAADIAADLGTVPTIPLRQEQLDAFMPFQQPVIATGKVRYVGEPLAVIVAESAALAEDAAEAVAVDIAPLPAVADRDAAANGPLLFDGADVQSRRHADRGEGRRRRRLSRGGLCAAGNVCRAAPHRGADGAARRPRRMARRPAHGLRRGQGAVSQPAHPGEAARRGGERDPHGRERRRRRLRRARRVLSGGFPHPVRGAARRAPGQVDRGPQGAPPRHQPRPRRRLRARDRLRPRRHHPRAARPRQGRRRRLYPHQRRDRRPQHRADPVGTVSRPEHPHAGHARR